MQSTFERNGCDISEGDKRVAIGASVAAVIGVGGSGATCCFCNCLFFLLRPVAAVSAATAAVATPTSVAAATSGYNLPKPNADVEVKFGKYKGQTIGQIAAHDKNWLEWAGENTTNDFMKRKIGEFLAA